MQDARQGKTKKMDARAAAIDKYGKIGRSQDSYVHAFCPADSMHEVRGYEARSRCQAIEQDTSRAAETSKMQEWTRRKRLIKYGNKIDAAEYSMGQSQDHTRVLPSGLRARGQGL